MSLRPDHLLLIAACAVATYLTRIGGFWLADRDLPAPLRRGLPYVPVAAFAAIIAQGVGVPGQVSLRLVVVAVTMAVMLVWKRVGVAIVAGMAGWWILRALGVA